MPLAVRQNVLNCNILLKINIYVYKYNKVSYKATSFGVKKLCYIIYINKCYFYNEIPSFYTVLQIFYHKFTKKQLCFYLIKTFVTIKI